MKLFCPPMAVAGEITEGKGQAAVRRLLLLTVCLGAVVLLGVTALLTEGSRLLDDLKTREDRFLIANALTRIGTRQVSDMTTVTVWDQAFVNLRPGGDLHWADAEVGSYYANNRGFDRTVVIDSRDRPFYAWVGKRRADPAGQAQFVADALPLIHQLRAIEGARGSFRPKVEPTDPTLAETAHGIMVSGGVRYLIGVSTVAPSDYNAPQSDEPAAMVLTAQALDERLRYSMSRMKVTSPRIVAESHALASLPLTDIRGRSVGAIVWTPQHPGLAAVRTAVPALSLGIGLFVLVMGILGWQIWRVTCELDAYERAHETAMHDLEEARDRAQSANVAKSQFLANMSHEIRTPLNGVLGMAQVLARDGLSADAHDKVEVIRTSGETLLSLLNDVLDLSKIEAGRLDVDVAPFDIAEVVAGATRPFVEAASRKDVAFTIDTDPEALGVWRGDGGKIGQVLGNLASNAVKFTVAGEVRLTVRRTAAGVSVTVADSGVGIPQAEMSRLFGRFTQVDPTRTRRFGGTGLGLAISRELAELMGGFISVASVEGEGSTFTFDVPLEWIGPAAEIEVAEALAPSLPPLRILAAEDNRSNQMLLVAMLAPLGVELQLVADGREAVAAYSQGGFDLILMDIQMPDMNGVDATRAIRALERAGGQKPIPILALSANVMRHQVEEYLACGMNGLVAKPIDMAALVSAIEGALSSEAAAA